MINENDIETLYMIYPHQQHLLVTFEIQEFIKFVAIKPKGTLKSHTIVTFIER